MKKKLLLAVLSLFMVSATGCVEVIELDDEQEDKFLQYSVYSVLQHDKNYLVELEPIDESYIIKPDTQEPTTQNPNDSTTNSGNNSTGNKPVGGNSTTVSNLSEALGVEGVTFTYKGFKVCDSYPEVEGVPAFVIKAVKGKKLVVLEFDMLNTTGSELKVDVSSKELYIKGIFNNSIRTNALVTLLPEALNTYIGKVPAGGTVNTVIVFEMSDGYVNNLSEITIDVKSKGGTKSIKIQ